ANGGDAPAATIVRPTPSFAQGWRLGALHERFFNGARAGSVSNLQEAGEVLGVGRPLTEEELLSLARVSEDAPRRSRSCCNLSDCMLVA
ncbi:unnamed protein product, partial [Ectocarpus sp. 4 AP-2014]